MLFQCVTYVFPFSHFTSIESFFRQKHFHKTPYNHACLNDRWRPYVTAKTTHFFVLRRALIIVKQYEWTVVISINARRQNSYLVRVRSYTDTYFRIWPWPLTPKTQGWSEHFFHPNTISNHCPKPPKWNCVCVCVCVCVCGWCVTGSNTFDIDL